MIADLHIHSRYSRATSQEMAVPKIVEYAKLKGIGMVATGDFTHPAWLKDLKEKLVYRDGIYWYDGIRFILNVEVNNIYTRYGKLRRVHNLIFAPDFETVEKINRYLGRFGKLEADGRPILSLDTYDMCRVLFEINPEIFVIPGHIWTPWFSLFGSNSGFDTVEECFGDLKDRIFAMETGLSSDPAMNWRWSALDAYALVSNSDAHSPTRLGREANVFRDDLDYQGLKAVLQRPDPQRFLYTIEFYPEEGKYHFDGHRKCQVRLSPREARFNNNLCPVCSRSLTIGVLHRVETLADREEGYRPEGRVPFRNLIPLEEIIAEALGVGRDTAVVRNEYLKLCRQYGSEFEVLLNVSAADLKNTTREKVAVAVEKARRGEIIINPGYDGEFGAIRIFADEQSASAQQQLGLF